MTQSELVNWPTPSYQSSITIRSIPSHNLISVEIQRYPPRRFQWSGNEGPGSLMSRGKHVFSREWAENGSMDGYGPTRGYSRVLLYYSTGPGVSFLLPHSSARNFPESTKGARNLQVGDAALPSVPVMGGGSPPKTSNMRCI